MIAVVIDDDEHGQETVFEWLCFPERFFYLVVSLKRFHGDGDITLILASRVLAGGFDLEKVGGRQRTCAKQQREGRAEDAMNRGSWHNGVSPG